MAVVIDALRDVAQQVEDRVGDPDVPVEHNVCTFSARIFPEEGFEHAA
jgi:hypothetical protein